MLSGIRIMKVIEEHVQSSQETLDPKSSWLFLWVLTFMRLKPKRS